VEYFGCFNWMVERGEGSEKKYLICGRGRGEKYLQLTISGTWIRV